MDVTRGWKNLTRGSNINDVSRDLKDVTRDWMGVTRG